VTPSVLLSLLPRFEIDHLPLSRNSSFVVSFQDAVDGPNGGLVSDILHMADTDGAGTDCLPSTPEDGFFFTSTKKPTQCGPFVVGWNDTATDPVGVTGEFARRNPAFRGGLIRSRPLLSFPPGAGMVLGGPSFDVPITNATARLAEWTFRVKAGSRVMFSVYNNGTAFVTLPPRFLCFPLTIDPLSTPSSTTLGNSEPYVVQNGSDFCASSEFPLLSASAAGRVPNERYVQALSYYLPSIRCLRSH
jgi:hypothetical protein